MTLDSSLFSKTADAGLALRFGSLCALAMGHGIRQKSASMGEELKDIWYLALLAAQSYQDRMSPAQAQSVNNALAPFGFASLAGQASSYLANFAGAVWAASSEAQLAGAGAYFKALLDTVDSASLVGFVDKVLPKGKDRAWTELPPPPEVQRAYKELWSPPAKAPTTTQPSRLDRFDRAEVRPAPKPAAPTPVPAPAVDRESIARTVVASWGWGGADLEAILGGPHGPGRT